VSGSLKKILATSAIVTTATVAGVSPLGIVHAETVNLTHPNLLLDNFSSFTYGTPGWMDFTGGPSNFAFLANTSTWWTTLNDGNAYRFYNVPCSKVTRPDNTVIGSGDQCLINVTNEDGHFMRFNLNPRIPEDNGYDDIALTDQADGFSYNQPHRWLPTVGHPVVFDTTMRWADVYKADGSGGFIGSSGVYLWNAPVDYAGGSFHGVRALGFDLFSNHSSAGDPGVVGFGASVDSTPEPPTGAYTPDMLQKFRDTSVNVNEWNHLRMEWSVDESGTQSVKFSVNGKVIGQTTLAQAFPSLEIEFWNDNYVLLPAGGGAFYPGFEPVPATQNVDVSFARIQQL